tara:strand:+ start:125 stop:259 length:135 start_codon:yes stop_codon:yes gene_type:complete
MTAQEMAQDVFTDIGLANKKRILIINKSFEYCFSERIRDTTNIY